eukprot:TRINITY_DN367_c0_g1_i1.p1 TRINITY_DN367_c0_g1~~TRINITY_DN367_c0_g1_i1.p1  ORF type:complete len:169 (+),score=91.44 TRINITY_DN367_c0_g1_i1:40-507(+)
MQKQTSKKVAPPKQSTTQKITPKPTNAPPAGIKTGGKGTVRRKKKVVSKAAATTNEDKNFLNNLKRLSFAPIKVEEVIFFKGTESASTFEKPTVLGTQGYTCYAVSGQMKEIPYEEASKKIDFSNQLKQLSSQLGDNQLGDNLDEIPNLEKNFSA